MFDSAPLPPITRTSKIFVLTGAGISAESGLSTFRDSGGIWEQHKIEDIATPEAFERDPLKVWHFYKERRRNIRSAVPNPAHYALAKLEKNLPVENFTLVTQNVDNLHRLAGSQNPYHMHGELSKLRCVDCHTVTENLEDFKGLPFCRCNGLLRPHVVWFNEMPFYLDVILDRLHECDIFVAVGTSGQVYPAAGFAGRAKSRGATTIGINTESPANMEYYDYFFKEKASVALPMLIEKWIVDIKKGT